MGKPLTSFKTLFLDRDGVINKHRPYDYVKSWDEFEFLPGVLEAFILLKDAFERIIMVTNQRGIGKGLMTETELQDIHKRMLSEIRKAGGRLDQIYYCIDINNDSLYRKPNPGMALQAQKDFPEIVFEESIMVGDSASDREFGNRLGMKTILVRHTGHPQSLLDFALSLSVEE